MFKSHVIPTQTVNKYNLDNHTYSYCGIQLMPLNPHIYLRTHLGDLAMLI